VALAGCDAIFDLEEVKYTPPPPCEPLDVDTGRRHTCAVDYRGEVRCWGGNSDGEVVPGAADLVPQPFQVALPDAAAQVAVGKQHSCARLVTGAIWCWGTNDENELALGPTTAESAVPVLISGVPPSAEISAGGYHTCSRSADDGTVTCWGSNEHGESGQATSLDCDPDDPDEGLCIQPTAVANTAGTKAIALGHRFSCLIDADDRVACWGRNNGRQLAVDEATEMTAVPTMIAQLGRSTAIAASGRSACAIETSGSVKCWGTGVEGQLGTGMFTSDPSPPAGTLIENARSLSLSNFGGCAVLRDGNVTCWGNTDAGSGTFALNLTPELATVTAARKISGDFFHHCAIANGELSCWGNNANAQLGRGGPSIVKSPFTAIASGATQIVAGNTHMCSIANGELYCWGDNEYGQAGDPSFTRTYVPTKIPTSVQLVGVAAGFRQTCVWGAGSAECWGQAWTGRLGTGSDQRSQGRSPVQVSGIDHVTIGGDHMCALLQNNTIMCFGFNGRGQVGLDPNQTRQSITGNTITNSGGALGTILQLSAGGRHTCARTSTGVWCWGSGEDGQLGYGGTADQYIPHQVTGLLATDLASGENFSCAVEATTGDVECWGRNSNGQLGINSRTASPNHVKVMNLPAKATRVFSGPGASSMCALLETGAFHCWGDGDMAQLGNGITNDQDLPSLAPGYAMATAAAMSPVGSCAIVGGAVKCVGEYTILGNDDHSLSVPTAVDLGIGACPLD